MSAPVHYKAVEKRYRKNGFPGQLLTGWSESSVALWKAVR